MSRALSTISRPMGVGMTRLRLRSNSVIPQIIFQLLELCGQRGLAHMAAFGGLTEVAAVRERD
jgi:hypothetical protein